MIGAPEFSRAAALEPELANLEKFVATLFRGDLPTVENWVARFTRIFNARPALEPYRRPVFAHLLQVHNVAVEQAAARKRKEAAK